MSHVSERHDSFLWACVNSNLHGPVLVEVFFLLQFVCLFVCLMYSNCMYSNCFYLFIIFLAGSFLRVALWSAGILGLVAAEALLGRLEHGESLALVSLSCESQKQT